MIRDPAVSRMVGCGHRTNDCGAGAAPYIKLRPTEILLGNRIVRALKWNSNQIVRNSSSGQRGRTLNE